MSHKHSGDRANMQQRRMVWQQVACPKCGAPKWDRCIGARGQRRFASHIDRWNLYRQQAGDK